jgi:hypothetical protein
MVSLVGLIDALVYLSVAWGIVLLYQLYSAVPSWLFFSVLIGWLAYLVIAVLVTFRRRIAYPLILVLAILTLVVSLPRPEHLAFVAAGISLASITFLVGSALQLILLVLVPAYLLRRRKAARQS